MKASGPRISQAQGAWGGWIVSLIKAYRPSRRKWFSITDIMLPFPSPKFPVSSLPKSIAINLLVISSILFLWSFCAFLPYPKENSSSSKRRLVWLRIRVPLTWIIVVRGLRYPHILESICQLNRIKICSFFNSALHLAIVLVIRAEKAASPSIIEGVRTFSVGIPTTDNVCEDSVFYPGVSISSAFV